jgi:hypothetical protein
VTDNIDYESIQKDAEFSHGGPPCLQDTNGDGDCGQPACPNCGKYRKAQDISDTPAPQRHTSTY